MRTCIDAHIHAYIHAHMHTCILSKSWPMGMPKLLFLEWGALVGKNIRFSERCQSTYVQGLYFWRLQKLPEVFLSLSVYPWMYIFCYYMAVWPTLNWMMHGLCLYGHLKIVSNLKLSFSGVYGISVYITFIYTYNKSHISSHGAGPVLGSGPWAAAGTQARSGPGRRARSGPGPV